jgi:hypothetical protein
MKERKEQASNLVKIRTGILARDDEEYQETLDLNTRFPKGTRTWRRRFLRS